VPSASSIPVTTDISHGCCTTLATQPFDILAVLYNAQLNLILLSIEENFEHALAFCENSMGLHPNPFKLLIS